MRYIGIILASIFLAGCNDTTYMQCEHDASDLVVDDAYCYDGVPGYEWDEAWDEAPHFTVKKTTATLTPSVRYTMPKFTKTTSSPRTK